MLLNSTIINFLLIISLLQIVYIFYLRKRIKQPAPPQPSEELSDFLTDVRGHGFGFVRVNPDNVFLRK